MVWGTMTALDTLVYDNPKEIYANIPFILDAMEKGSVITKDHGVILLAKLSSLTQYEQGCFTLLMEQLTICPGKQLPMYAEKSLIAVTDKNSASFKKTLLSRNADLEKNSQKKRIDKVLKKVGQIK